MRPTRASSGSVAGATATCGHLLRGRRAPRRRSDASRAARSHLLWLARSNRLPSRRVDEVLELVGLSEAARRRTGGFSLGMAQRLGIAAALLGDPPVLLFDEPINGLDPDGIRWIRAFLRELAAEGRAVLVSSHLMGELEGIADELVVIGRGRLIAQTSVSELLASRSDGRVHVRTPQLTEVMAALAGAGAIVTSTGSDALLVRASSRSASPSSCPSTGCVSTSSTASGPPSRTPSSTSRATRSSTSPSIRGGRAQSTAAFAEVVARAGAPQALRSEWVKFRTVRSTFWSLLLLAGVSILFTSVLTGGSSTEGGSPGNRGDNDIVLESLAGIWFGQIAAAVLAVLAITSEYSTRMIRTTFAANPRRRTVLATKAVVVTSIVLTVGLATSAACFQIGQWLLRQGGFNYEGGYPAVTLADGFALRAVVLSGVYLGLLALFSLGVGAIVRHTAAAITIVLAAVLAPVIAIGFCPRTSPSRSRNFRSWVRASRCSRPSNARTTSRSSRHKGWPSSPRTASSRCSWLSGSSGVATPESAARPHPA